MIQINSILDAYIDANLLLIFAFSMWIVVRFLVAKLGMSHAYTTQLKLLNGVFLAVALSPFFVFGFGQILQSGVVSNEFSLNLSDFVLAQYLNGSIEMKPTQFENILGMRDAFTDNLLGLKTTTSIVIAAFLASGFAAVVTRTTLSVIRLRRIIRNSFAWRRFGNIHLLLSDTTHVPFSTRSLRKHFIVIPSGMLAQNDDLRMALGHEFQHLRQGDIEWEITLEMLKPLFFWNPAFLFWKRQVEHLRELTCDQQVLSRKGYDVQAYCECLLRVCHNSLRKTNRLQIIVPSVAFVQVDRSLFGSQSVRFLRHRMTSLFDADLGDRYNKSFRLLLVPLMGIIILTSLAIQKPNDWSQDRIMLSTIINLERLDVRNSLGQ